MFYLELVQLKLPVLASSLQMKFKLNRKQLFKIHSWIGIKLSILFFIVCFSGTMATISHELDWLFNPAIRAKNTGSLASKNLIIENVKKKFPDGQIMYWAAATEPYTCDILHILDDNKRTFVFANPYTGQIQGSAKLTFQRFFRDLHYFLFIPFQIGHFTVLIFGFLLLISTLTALYFYKSWYTKLFELKTNSGKVVFFRSLHRLIGVWSVPFTLLFSITGIWYFAERTNLGGVSSVANNKAPKVVDMGMDSVALAQISHHIDYDRAIVAAQNAIPGLVAKDIQLPTKNTAALYITGKSDAPLVRNRANRVYIHPQHYQVVGTKRAEDAPVVTWINDIADPLHFGYWGGLATKLIWFLAGLCISGLVLSGLWVSLKRKVKNLQKAKAQRMGRWKYTNLVVFLAMLFFMYYFMFNIYHVGWGIVLLATLVWAASSWAWWYWFSKRVAHTK